MKPLPKDTYEKKSNFKQFDDGQYTVTGIQWFTLNDKKEPVLVAQKNGQLVGRCRMRLTTDGNDKFTGPPHSSQLGEMILLGVAFGVDIKKLPAYGDSPKSISDYMKALQDACNASGRSVNIKVKDGWVNSIEGGDIEIGTYEGYLTDISPKNKKGQPIPKDSPSSWGGKYFFVNFTLDSGVNGEPSLYRGYQFSAFVTYAIEVDEDTGETDWKRDENDEPDGDAGLMSNLMMWSAPGIFDNWSPPNPHNVLPYWLKQVNKNIRFRIPIVPRPRSDGMTISWATFKPVDVLDDPVQLVPPVENEVPSEPDENHKAQQLFAKHVNEVVGIEVLRFNGDRWECHKKGGEMLGKLLTPLKGDIIKSQTLEELTFDELLAACPAMMEVESKMSSFHSELSKMGLGLDEKEEEEEWTEEETEDLEYTETPF